MMRWQMSGLISRFKAVFRVILPLGATVGP